MTLGTLVRHPNPARRAVRRDYDRIFDDLWGGLGLAPVSYSPRSQFDPTFEARELESEYRVTGDVPGVEPEALEVTVHDGVLTVKGHRRAEGESSAEGEVSRVDARGSFERRFRFPAEIVESEVKAACKHGVLTVTIPKPVEAKPEVRNIPVETA